MGKKHSKNNKKTTEYFENEEKIGVDESIADDNYIGDEEPEGYEGYEEFNEGVKANSEDIPKAEYKKIRKKRRIWIISVIAVLLIAVVVIVSLQFKEPVFVLKGDESVIVPYNTEYTDGGFGARTVFRDISDKVIVAGEVDTKTIGEYILTYSLNYMNKSYTLKRTVTVADITAPVITLENEELKIVSAMKLYSEPGFSASDDYDGDITDKVEVVSEESDGKLTVTYSVSDSSGNETKAQRIIEIKDIIPPVLTVENEEETVTVPEYTPSDMTASDDVDGDITSKIFTDSDYKTFTEGTFTFSFSVTDSSGNNSTAKKTVYVKDTVAPAISVNGSDNIQLTVGDSYSDAGAYANDAFEGDLTSSIVTSGSVDTSTPGTYTISYSVADSKGNSAEISRTVRVNAKPAQVDGAVNGQGVVGDSTVYLTFDDGPGSNITPQILDVLSANNVKATFFIIGYSDANKAIIQRAINEGHTIGIHCLNHSYSEVYASPEAFMNSINTMHDKILADFGYDTNIIRFPGGASNTISARYCKGIMTTLCNLVVQSGYTYFDWNISSGDAEGNSVPSSTIISNVTGGLKHGRNNVVLMHDTNAKKTTLASLRSIIDYANSNGYTFAALSSYTTPVRHTPNN